MHGIIVAAHIDNKCVIQTALTGHYPAECFLLYLNSVSENYKNSETKHLRLRVLFKYIFKIGQKPIDKYLLRRYN